MHYRDLADLTKHLSPDVVQLNDLAPRVDNIVIKGIAPSPLEDRFLACWVALGGRPLQREVRFHPTRRWRFDFAIIDKRIGIEIQGGLYQAQSGHRSKAGVERDCEKLNAAQLLGWQVFFVTASAIDDSVFVMQLIHHCQVL
jgi:very-short-patch-repair endonuclease